MKSSDITVTDQFCGAGGSSTGAKSAGARVRLALNHWELAVETHNTNHPEVDHDCTDIQACDPRRYPSTTILITSPECTNHSLAKGQKRKHQAQMELFGTCSIDANAERSRATMWDVPRFAEYHNYEAIIVENVVDARYWVMYDAWLKAMHLLGYEHKAVFLNSMFVLPTPQSRDRMYVVFWKKGNKAPDLEYRPTACCTKCGGQHEAFQAWKNAGKKWGKYKQQYIYRCTVCNNEVTPYYYAAWNAIDWSIKSEKIGDRKTPLSPNTIKRIESGLRKYGQQPMSIASGYASGVDCRVGSLAQQALGTQVGSVKHGIVVPPFIVKSAYGGGVKDVSEAMYTQTTEQTLGLCIPLIIENYGTSSGGRSVIERMGTITAGGINHGLLIGNYSPGWARSTVEPTGTVTTSDHHGLVSHESLAAYIQYYYSGTQTSHITEALGTVTTTDRASLIQPSVKIEDCHYRMLRPHEIQAAMAFPDTYQVLGNSREKVKQLGNAVTPPVMEWLVRQVIESLN